MRNIKDAREHKCVQWVVRCRGDRNKVVERMHEEYKEHKCMQRVVRCAEIKYTDGPRTLNYLVPSKTNSGHQVRVFA